jgi:hypothetical protein
MAPSACDAIHDHDSVRTREGVLMHGMAWQPYAKKDPSLYLSLYP